MAAQGLRARPEAFWSVLKEPQKSTLAGYRFESSCLLPPPAPSGCCGFAVAHAEEERNGLQGPMALGGVSREEAEQHLRWQSRDVIGSETAILGGCFLLGMQN